MSIYASRDKNRYLFRKYAFGSVFWEITWPKSTDRENWRVNITTVASRCGHSVTFNDTTATVTDVAGHSVTLEDNRRKGDWRALFFVYVDAIFSHKLDAPATDVIFPKIAETPVCPALRDGFTPTELENLSTGERKPFLRVLKSVSYSELLKLDGAAPVVSTCGVLRGHKTDLKLFECACGRLFVAHPSIQEYRGAWDSCGCTKTIYGGYTGVRVDTVRGAWREWCTMKLLQKTPEAALHQLLAEEGLTMQCDLPDDFETFWRLYFCYAKKEKQLLSQRIDKTKPFALDNFTLATPRWLFEDPSNKQHFKLGI